MEYCDIDLFDDDATFHANGKTKSEVEPKLQTDGEILNHGQNITKCKYITIKRHA